MTSDLLSDAKRPAGRPKAAEPGSAVTTWVPVTLHDRLVELAQRNGDSLSATVRQLLQRRAT